jgi:hypothetical protein
MSSPSLPPDGQLPLVRIEGTGHHISFGGNVKSENASAFSVQQFFTKQMASHGLGYWVIHGIVALIAAGVFEALVWHYHWFGH